jgi:hypothetical protein
MMTVQVKSLIPFLLLAISPEVAFLASPPKQQNKKTSIVTKKILASPQKQNTKCVGTQF